MLHKVDAASLSPDFQLVDGRRTEGIRRRHEHLFALGLEIGRHLADGGGLSRAVYADNKMMDGWVSIWKGSSSVSISEMILLLKAP